MAPLRSLENCGTGSKSTLVLPIHDKAPGSFSLELI